MRRKRNWQVIAFISLIIVFACVMWIGYIGGQNKLVPYMVEVDKLGNTHKVGMVKNINIKSVNAIKGSLNTFIFSWRTIWGNPEIQRKFIFDAYNYTLPKSKAFNILNDYYTKVNPFERASKENVRVKITNLIPQNANTWQVEWEETITTKTAEIISKDIYRAFFEITQIEPTTEEQILKNPFGIFITDINYSKILQ